jgi:hypothetical protein
MESATIFYVSLKFPLDSCRFVAPSLTRGLVCKLLYNCFWALPELSLLGRSPTELTEILRLPQPGGPGLRIYIPQEQGGPGIPPGTGFPFVPSYDSQGYGGGILTRLHTGLLQLHFVIFL